MYNIEIPLGAIVWFGIFVILMLFCAKAYLYFSKNFRTLNDGLKHLQNTEAKKNVVRSQSSIIAGRFHNLLLYKGKVVAWGWNQQGQCDVPAPNTDFVAVVAGNDHSLGLKSDGSTFGSSANREHDYG